MNLFQSILDKAKSGVSSYNTMMEGVGSKAYDWANPNQDPIQRFLDDPNIEATKKQALFSDLQAGKPKEAISSYISEKYYPQAQFRETVPMAQPFFPATGKENALVSSAKFIGNIPTSLYNIGAGGVNLASTAVQEGIGPTASMIGQGAIRMAGQGAESVSQAYQEGGVIGATERVLEGTKKAIVQDPALLFAPQMIKGAGQATVAGGRIIKEGAEVVAPRVVQGVKTGAEVTGNIVSAPFKSIYNTAKQYAGTPDEIAGIQSAIKPKQKVKNGVVQRSQKQIDNEIQLTNGIIRNKGVKPTDLETYATAQKDILKEIGGEIERLTGQPLDIDMTPSSSKLRQLANTREVQLLDTGDAQRLLKIADDLDANPRMSLADAEAMNQYINDVLRSTTSTASEAYKRGLQILVQDLRDSLDNAISNIPGEFKDLKRAYGAVRNVYGDTIARQIVFNRQNMGGLIDSFGAIEGFGNIMGGAGKIVTGKVGEGFVDIGKGVTQNAVGRFIKSKNDPNNIIRAIFEKGGKESIIPDIKTKPKAPTPLLPARATPRAIPLGKSQAEIIAESKKGLSPNIKRPDGNNTRNSANSSPVLDMGTTKGSKQKVIKPKAKPSPQVKPVEKTVKPLTPKKQSATMGDMETKKLIKPIQSYKGENGSIKDILKSKYSDKVETLDIYENESAIFLNRVKVKEQGKGIGTDILSEMKKYADRTGKRIELTPEKIANTSKEKLIQWYKKNGFVENKGKNKDFSTREAMYYSPKK